MISISCSYSYSWHVGSSLFPLHFHIKYSTLLTYGIMSMTNSSSHKKNQQNLQIFLLLDTAVLIFIYERTYLYVLSFNYLHLKLLVQQKISLSPSRQKISGPKYKTVDINRIYHFLRLKRLLSDVSISIDVESILAENKPLS